MYDARRIYSYLMCLYIRTLPALRTSADHTWLRKASTTLRNHCRNLELLEEEEQITLAVEKANASLPLAKINHRHAGCVIYMNSSLMQALQNRPVIHIRGHGNSETFKASLTFPPSTL